MSNYKDKICPNPRCHKTFTPRTCVQDYCSKICGIYDREMKFREKNGMRMQIYRRLKRKYRGNAGILVYLKSRKRDIDNAIKFVESGGKTIKSDKNWKWGINRK